MPITFAVQARSDIVDDSVKGHQVVKFQKGIIYNSLIQDGVRYVITREHEPIKFEEIIFKKLFKKYNGK